jgi:hypothetical protein
VAKYDALRNYLFRPGAAEVSMTIDEIGDLGGDLPGSAFRHRAWWANEADGGHVQTKTWLEPGGEVVEVALAGRSVVFAAHQAP